MRDLLAGLMLVCLVAAPGAAQRNLKLTIGAEDVDVKGRTIHFRLGTVAASAELQLFSPEGELLHVEQREYDAPAPGTRLSIGWPDVGKKGENFRAELKITDAEGYWIGYQAIYFYQEVPHEDVALETAKWDVTDAEAKKLDGPLAQLKEAARKYAALMDVKLYVAGHTDTVGKAADNQTLSDKRARAIARYFIDHGLTGIPIFVRGFGEGAPAVKTDDEVAEARNRRAQYIISSFTPAVAGPGSWTRIK